MSVSEHAFIQALLARGCMKLEEAEALFKSLQKQGGSGALQHCIRRGSTGNLGLGLASCLSSSPAAAPAGTFADFTSSVKKSLAIADLTFTQRRIVASGGSQETWVGIVNVVRKPSSPQVGEAECAAHLVAALRSSLRTRE